MSGSDRRRRFAWIGAAVVAALIVAGVVGWVTLFGGDAPAVAGLSSPSSTASDTTSPTSTASGSTDGFDGSWTVDTTSGSLADGTATFAGYRVEEQLGGIGANTAVGRTPDVTGSMTIEGTSITALEVTVDMTTLVSDDDRRDGQLVMRGLETGRFPTATFTSTEPIDLGSTPKEGEYVEATATGTLTLHGVTNEVEVPVEAQWTGERIEIAGHFDVALADYGIEPPVGFLVLSIADTGTVELHLLLEKQ
jgi:polyisoprenoid-binding protein YceI